MDAPLLNALDADELITLLVFGILLVAVLDNVVGTGDFDFVKRLLFDDALLLPVMVIVIADCDLELIGSVFMVFG